MESTLLNSTDEMAVTGVPYFGSEVAFLASPKGLVANSTGISLYIWVTSRKSS